MNRLNKSYLLVFFILILATFATYIKSFGYEFVYDDFIIVVTNKQIHSLSLYNIFKIFSSMNANYLPTRVFSYAVDYHFWGYNPGGLRLTNFFFHSLNSILGFLAFMKVSAASGISSKKFLPFAAASAIIFAIHPLQVESVVWVSGRKDLLSLFFVLSAFHFFWATRTRTLISNSRFLILMALFLLAVTSKASAIYLPVFLIAVDMVFFWKQSSKEYRRQMLTEHTFLLITALIVAYVDISGSVNAEIVSSLSGNSGAFSHILTIMQVPWLYIGMFFYPINLNAEYHISVIYSIAKTVALFGGAAVILASLILSFKRRKDIFFSILWFFIALFPVSQIFPIEHIVADRYFYHSMVPLCYIIGAGFLELSKRVRPAAITMVILVPVLLISVTLKQCEFWQNEYTLWNRVLQYHESPRAYHNIAQYYLRLGDKENAEKNYLKAIQVAPEDFSPRAMLAQLYFTTGRNEEAIVQMEKMIEIRKDAFQVYRNLGILYKKTGNFEKAEQTYKRAMELFPDSLYFRKALLNVRNTDGTTTFEINIEDGKMIK